MGISSSTCLVNAILGIGYDVVDNKFQLFKLKKKQIKGNKQTIRMQSTQLR